MKKALSWDKVSAGIPSIDPRVQALQQRASSLTNAAWASFSDINRPTQAQASQEMPGAQDITFSSSVDWQGDRPPANWDSIRRGIFAGESGGDYNALFGYSNREGKQFSNTRLTDMTVDDAIRFSDPSGNYGQWVKNQIGRVATPMGAYQIVGTTLRAAKDGLGLKGNERMSPALQDALGYWIYQQQGTGAWEGYKGPIG